MSNFPKDVVYHLFGFLPIEAVCRFARVCKSWRIVSATVETDRCGKKGAAKFGCSKGREYALNRIYSDLQKLSESKKLELSSSREVQLGGEIRRLAEVVQHSTNYGIADDEASSSVLRKLLPISRITNFATEHLDHGELMEKCTIEVESSEGLITLDGYSHCNPEAFSSATLSMRHVEFGTDRTKKTVKKLVLVLWSGGDGGDMGWGPTTTQEELHQNQEKFLKIVGLIEFRFSKVLTALLPTLFPQNHDQFIDGFSNPWEGEDDEEEGMDHVGNVENALLVDDPDDPAAFNFAYVENNFVEYVDDFVGFNFDASKSHESTKKPGTGFF